MEVFKRIADVFPPPHSLRITTARFTHKEAGRIRTGDPACSARRRTVCLPGCLRPPRRFLVSAGLYPRQRGGVGVLANHDAQSSGRATSFRSI